MRKSRFCKRPQNTEYNIILYNTFVKHVSFTNDSRLFLVLHLQQLCGKSRQMSEAYKNKKNMGFNETWLMWQILMTVVYCYIFIYDFKKFAERTIFWYDVSSNISLYTVIINFSDHFSLGFITVL